MDAGGRVKGLAARFLRIWVRSVDLRGFPATFGPWASHHRPPGPVGSVRANQGRKAGVQTT